MLYLIYRANHDQLDYRGGQNPIVHLEADLIQTVEWAESQGQKWAFTLSNAGARYFEDRCTLAALGDIDWDAVQARDWQQHREGKQAEFLIEHRFPWELISRIGVYSKQEYMQVALAIRTAGHKPRVEIKRDWYY